MARRKIFQRLQQFILVWPGDENLQVGFNGDVFLVPPRDGIAVTGEMGSPYRYPSATDAKGKPVPGTITIQDRIVQAGPAGGHRKIFDAAEACAFMEDSRDDLFDRGFAICMNVDEVAEALEEGRPKYEASQDEMARETLHAELERRKKWDMKGIPPPPSSSDHKIRWAVAHLEARAKATPQVSDDSLKKVLGGSLPEISMPSPEVMEPIRGMAMQPPAEEAPQALPVTTLFQMADAAGINMTKAEMAKLLNGDVEFRGKLMDQIAAKQEGERATA